MTLLRELVRPRTAAKAETGIGAVHLTYDPKLYGRERDHRTAAKRGQELGTANSWVRACERAISALFASVDTELLAQDGEPITEDSPEDQRAVLDLLQKPYRPEKGDPRRATPYTGRGLRNVTSRHMGLSGGGFWYLSQTEMLAGTPLEMLYINPARMEPHTDEQGSLLGWIMDQGGRNPVGFTPDEIMYFPLEDPDHGHTAVGLVESALSSADVVRLADRQAAGILSTGGRLAGIFAPKEGQMNDSVYAAVTRDLRTISEMPDAAKRSYVLKGAVEFTPTSVSPTDLDLVALSEMGRDALLALWGVPLSQLGGSTAAGLNSGERPKHDEATLWNAVGSRLDILEEVIQTQLLDRYIPLLGWAPQIVTHRPTFDDDMPLYEMAKAALKQPITDDERRAILKLPPLDEAQRAELAAKVPVPLFPETAAKAKPLKASLDDDLRKLIATASPRLRRAFQTFSEAQRDRVIEALRKRATHIQTKPGDDSAYFDRGLEDRELAKVMEAETVPAAERTASKITQTGQVLEAVRLRAAQRTAQRVTLINETTRKAIRDLVVVGLEQGASPQQLGVLLRDVKGLTPLPGDANAWEPVLNGAERTFANELRAETIARTELMQASNTGALDSYQELGVKMVEASDGDEDEMCAARDGRRFTLEDAANETAAEHPNGTLVWIPVTEFDQPEATGKASMPQVVVSPNIHVDAPVIPAPIIRVPDVIVPDITIPDIHVPETVVNIEAPVVNVEAAEAPVVNVPAPVVNVPAPVVNVEAQKADMDDEGVRPVFVVNMPEGKTATVIRGPDGRITGARTD